MVHHFCLEVQVYLQKLVLKYLILIFLTILISACDNLILEESKTWTAYKDDKAVLEFQDKPGFIASTGYFPDVEPVKHPFLSATALTPDEEDTIGKIIAQAVTFDEFVSLLEENGYEVR